MDAILRGSLPLGGVARRVSLDCNPNGMAAQVAVGKLMVGAKASLAAKIVSGREVTPVRKYTAVGCVPVGHAIRRPQCLRGGAAFLRTALVRLVFGAEVAELERFASARRR